MKKNILRTFAPRELELSSNNAQIFGFVRCQNDSSPLRMASSKPNSRAIASASGSSLSRSSLSRMANVFCAASCKIENLIKERRMWIYMPRSWTSARNPICSQHRDSGSVSQLWIRWNAAIRQSDYWILDMKMILLLRKRVSCCDVISCAQSFN